MKEFSQFYFDSSAELVMVDSIADVPREVEDWCTLAEATTQLQKMGCVGHSFHEIQSSFDNLCFTVVKRALQEIGEVFPKVLRGVRSQRPDSEYKILFGTRDPLVAAFYGDEIKVYENIKGLQIKGGITKSVVTSDWDYIDDEIIFFPNSDNYATR